MTNSSRRTRQAARRRSRATGEPLSVARRRATDPDPVAITAAWQQLRDTDTAGAEWDASQHLLRVLPGRLDLVDALDWTTTDTGIVARINPRLAEAGIVLPGEVRLHVVTAAARELGVDVDIAVAPGSLGISATTAFGTTTVTVVATIDTDETGLDAVAAEALVTAHRAIRPRHTFGTNRRGGDDLESWRFDEVFRTWCKSRFGTERDRLRLLLDARAATENAWHDKWGGGFDVPAWIDARAADFDENRARYLREVARPCPTCGRWWELSGGDTTKCPAGHPRPRTAIPDGPKYPSSYSPEHDVNPVCGHHLKWRCGGCGTCYSCDGCYCDE